MKRLELTAALSALLCGAAALCFFYIAGPNWHRLDGWLVPWMTLINSDTLSWAIAYAAVAGLATSLAALWSVRLQRRQNEAVRAVRVEGWGADAQEAALAGERDRLSEVRRTVDRKLTAFLSLGLAAVCFVAFWTLFSDAVIVDDRDTADTFFIKTGRAVADFGTYDRRLRLAGAVCVVFALLSLAAARSMRAVSKLPGAAVFGFEAGAHQVRALLFLFAAGVYFGDALEPDSYWRTWRWAAFLPPALLYWRLSGGNWNTARWLGLTAFLLLMGLAAGADDREWRSAAAVIVVVFVGLQSLELLLHAFFHPGGRTGQYQPLPGETLLAEFSEGRGIRFSVGYLRDRIGADIEEGGARNFVTEYAGGTLMAVIFVFYLSTCVVTVKPWERGIREQFGIAVDERDAEGNRVYLEPGIHFKFPWPIERVFTVPTDTIEQVVFGMQSHDHNTEIVMWDSEHYGEEFEMLTGEKMLAAVIASMHYRVADPWLYYMYVAPETAADIAAIDEAAGHKAIESASANDYMDDIRKRRGARHGPGALMAQVGYRTLTEVVGKNSIWALMADGRGALEKEIHERVQRHLNELHTGIVIVRVNLQDVHPPIKDGTAASFEEVLTAMEKREIFINVAQGDANQLLTEAKGRGREVIAGAMAERFTRIRNTTGEVARYAEIAKVRAASPQAKLLSDHVLLTEARLRVLRDRQLYILPPGLTWKLLMTDEPTLLDVVPPPPATKAEH